MITITPQAKAKVLEFMQGQAKPTYLKIQVSGKTAQAYQVQFLLEETIGQDDVKHEIDELTILVAKQDQEKVQGSTIEWVESVSGSGFHLNNPNKPTSNLNSPLAERVQEVLDGEINPSIAAHGGHIELLDISEGKAFVKMSGGCQGCSSAKATLKQGVEVRIKALIPEIIELVDTTDHAEGSNPYYTA